MARLAVVGSIALISLACATLPACGQQDETQRILAECSDPPPSAVDSCLEQARVQEETDPSPDLQKLVASLIKRQVEARNQPQDLAPLPPMPTDGSDPNAYDSPPVPPPSSDLDSGSSYDAPPDTPSADVAPPVEQGSPDDADQDNTDQAPDSGAPNPPPQGDGPGRAND
ncbi:MAG TPA: hypothetical protein VLT91_02385 [Rhizomicrobium sp.]|nr:hypothetical protein [Rhizomicrobium sp.]